MREIRTYGSEGGAAGKPAVPTPIKTLSRCNERLPDEDDAVNVIRHKNERVQFDFGGNFR